MTGPASRARSRDRVARLCESPADARTLRAGLLALVGEAVGFDAYAWLLTDPETEVGSAPLADVPCLHELPRLVVLKYLTTVNRWTTLDDPPVGLLLEATGGDPSRSRLWRDLLEGYGIVDVASTVFRDRFGCWGFLDLWRDASQGPFTHADADFLAEIAGPVTSALRRSLAGTFEVPRSQDPPGPGPAVLLLSPDLEVRAQTPPTQGYLRALVPPAPDQDPVPAGAYNVAAQLMAQEAGVDRGEPSARTHLADGRWVTLRAARMGGAGRAGAADIAVTIEETLPAGRTALYARVCGLSPRETELVGLLATGADTREVARRMLVSEHTVQDHLKAIFDKTGTRSRSRLLTRALGTHASAAPG